MIYILAIAIRESWNKKRVREDEDDDEEEPEKEKEKEEPPKSVTPVKATTRTVARATRSSPRLNKYLVSPLSSIASTPSSTGTVSIKAAEIVETPEESDCYIVDSPPSAKKQAPTPPRKTLPFRSPLTKNSSSSYAKKAIKYFNPHEEFLVKAMNHCGIRSPPVVKSNSHTKSKGPGHPMEVKYPYVYFSWYDADSSIKDSIHIALPKTDPSGRNTQVSVVDDGYGLSVTWRLSPFLVSHYRLLMLDPNIDELNGKVTSMKKSGKNLMMRHGSQGEIYATMYIPLEEQVVDKIVSSEIVDFPLKVSKTEIEVHTYHLIDLKRKEEPSPLTKTCTSGRKLQPLILFDEGNPGNSENSTMDHISSMSNI